MRRITGCGEHQLQELPLYQNPCICASENMALWECQIVCSEAVSPRRGFINKIKTMAISMNTLTWKENSWGSPTPSIDYSKDYRLLMATERRRITLNDLSNVGRWPLTPYTRQQKLTQQLIFIYVCTCVHHIYLCNNSNQRKGGGY